MILELLPLLIAEIVLFLRWCVEVAENLDAPKLIAEECEEVSDLPPSEPPLSRLPKEPEDPKWRAAAYLNLRVRKYEQGSRVSCFRFFSPWKNRQGDFQKKSGFSL